MNTQQLQAIAGLVEPFVQSEEDRHTLIAGLFPENTPDFNLSGDPAGFARRLVHWLHDRGQLEALLTAIHDRTGADAQAQIDALRQFIATEQQANEVRQQAAAAARNVQRNRWIALAVILLAVVAVVIAGLLIRQAVDEQNSAETQQAEADQRIADANTQVAAAGTAQYAAESANTQVAVAAQILTPVPITLTAASTQIMEAQAAQAEAEALAAEANTQAAVAAQTMTSIPPTLTQVAMLQQEAQAEQDIAIGFTNALLDVDNDPQDALNQVNDMVDRYPEAASVYLTRGMLYTTMERYDDAIADYTYATELKPDYVLAYSARASVYADMGGHYEQAIADYDRAIELDPENIRYYNKRGVAYKNIGRYEAAADSYDRAIEIAPDDPIAYNNRGLVYYYMGYNAKAITDYDRAIELDPEFADAYAGRGHAHYNLGHYDDAIADFSSAIEIDPANTSAYAGRGDSYKIRGRYEEAIADYDHAIALNPNHAFAHYNRGTAYVNLGRYEEAIANFNTAIEISPIQTGFYYERGWAKLLLGEYRAAIPDFTHVIENISEDNYLYNRACANRGVAYSRLGDDENALADFSRAIELAPRERNYYTNRGFTYLRTKQYDLAIADFDQAIQLGTEVTAFMYRAIAFKHQGDDESAQADFATFLKYAAVRTVAMALPTPGETTVIEMSERKMYRLRVALEGDDRLELEVTSPDQNVQPLVLVEAPDGRIVGYSVGALNPGYDDFEVRLVYTSTEAGDYTVLITHLYDSAAEGSLSVNVLE